MSKEETVFVRFATNPEPKIDLHSIEKREPSITFRIQF